MQRLGVAARERFRQPRTAGPLPALELGARTRGGAGLALERAHDALGFRFQLGERARRRQCAMTRGLWRACE